MVALSVWAFTIPTTCACASYNTKKALINVHYILLNNWTFFEWHILLHRFISIRQMKRSWDILSPFLFWERIHSLFHVTSHWSFHRCSFLPTANDHSTFRLVSVQWLAVLKIAKTHQTHQKNSRLLLTCRMSRRKLVVKINAVLGSNLVCKRNKRNKRCVEWQIQVYL